MITEDYVSFETAKLLKEKGFDEECCPWYGSDGNIHKTGCEMRNSDCALDSMMAPTLQMAMKWLRETHHIFIDIISRFSRNADNDVCFSYSCKTPADTYELIDGEWLCYEEAAEAAIKYCLEKLI